MDKKYTIAVAGIGDGDIIGTTKKNRVKSRLLAAWSKSQIQIFMKRGIIRRQKLPQGWLLGCSIWPNYTEHKNLNRRFEASLCLAWKCRVWVWRRVKINIVIPLVLQKVEQGRRRGVERVKSRQSDERSENEIHPDSCQDNAHANHNHSRRYAGLVSAYAALQQPVWQMEALMRSAFGADISFRPMLLLQIRSTFSSVPSRSWNSSKLILLTDDILFSPLLRFCF